MKIRKSQLRKQIRESLQVFFSDSKPFATVGRSGGIPGVEVDEEALEDVIEQTMEELESNAKLRMQAEAAGVKNTGDILLKKNISKMINEISGVDSLKPNDPHTPDDEAEKDAADDVMEADPKAKKGGRPRGGPHIENVRFWDLPESSLRYIIKDASQAMNANPMARKALKWADEVNDAVTVLHWRKKKGITVEEGKDEKKKDKIKRRPWVDGLDPAGGIGEAKDVMTRATNPKTKAIIAKMQKLVKDKLKLKSVERIDPVTSDDYNGIAFVFGDKGEGNKFAKYLKSQRALGKIRNLTGNRIMVSLHY